MEPASKEAKEFKTFVSDFNLDHPELFKYTYYEVLGINNFGQFSLEKYNERLNSLTKLFQQGSTELNQARDCINKAKITLQSEKEKKRYDEFLKHKFVDKLIDSIKAYAHDGIIDKSEKEEILKRGIEFGLESGEIDTLLKDQKNALGFQFGSHSGPSKSAQRSSSSSSSASNSTQYKKQTASSPRLKISPAGRLNFEGMISDHTYSIQLDLEKSGTGSLTVKATTNRSWLKVKPDQINSDDFPRSVKVIAAPGTEGLKKFEDRDIGEVKFKASGSSGVKIQSVPVVASLEKEKDFILRKIRYVPYFSAALAIFCFVWFFHSIATSDWTIVGLVASLIGLGWGGWFLFNCYKTYYEKDRWSLYKPGFLDHLGFGAGVVILFISSLKAFIIVALVGVCFGISYLVVKYLRPENKFTIPLIPISAYLVFFMVVLLLSLSGSKDIVSEEKEEENYAGIVQPNINTKTLLEGTIATDPGEPVRESAPVVEPIEKSQEGNMPEESNRKRDRSEKKQIIPDKGVKVKSSFWGKSVNETHTRSLFNHLSRAKIDEILELITEDSKLELLLYAKRFSMQDRIITLRKHLPQFEINDISEFMLTEDTSYMIVEFTLYHPKKKRSEYYMNSLVNSFSPWIVFLGDGRYRDSIPVINGLIEFNYGKDKGMANLKAASMASVNVDWLNVREAPSMNARIIGKLKSQDSGEWHHYGEINGMMVQDYQHTILADPEHVNNGFIQCYVIDERSGKYETGYTWKEYLDVGENVYR